ncbi:hypothetical protein L227DRAFT_576264 [Lentinus tigrinus ALCF2SS1-6]|uniref:Uncharacterized protein n=1 Tax=Lentinus tigrinus ALCF2SS1-6 TaxID=1328759 RepID=A0A5C2S8Q7_9APHY|nr:hypothetical protein L227DRAFT_576264 [Lentinus tigrinus ALCF2SS1-6]
MTRCPPRPLALVVGPPALVALPARSRACPLSCLPARCLPALVPARSLPARSRTCPLAAHPLSLPARCPPAVLAHLRPPAPVARHLSALARLHDSLPVCSCRSPACSCYLPIHSCYSPAHPLAHLHLSSTHPLALVARCRLPRYVCTDTVIPDS